MKTVLSIAGSDPSGGAGIQADLKTFCAFKVYGMAAITSLTAQNTIGVQDVYHVPSAFLVKQLKSIHEDIRIDAIKIGMLGTLENVLAVSQFIEETKVANIVLDPVLISGSGEPLLEEDAVQILKDTLINLCTIITPNLIEASILSGMKVTDISSMKEAATELFSKTGAKSVLIKGGHLEGKAVDILFDGMKFETYEAPKVQKSTHGTGCTLSSAIAAGLARGFELKEAVSKGKGYVLNGIKSGFDDIGKGNHPLNHFVPI
ncbi:MAG: bifunctional hydroxymethylpyrimidine kinase/phosphomethylpyrimidine kinase [Deltaproteobacteria bacterium GWA2_47_9]|nr:MAG: bifunctional hydroxymethylpyrimidine kinase/phosphomethylpyrimidine kinase [Deltaproteobacteria bacterium GWA2_47_9]